MGPSVDQVVQGVVTARELNVQPDQIRRQVAAPSPSHQIAFPGVVARDRSVEVKPNG